MGPPGARTSYDQGVDPLQRIAERRIEEALKQGAFDDFPGKGAPLEVEDVSALDPEVRASYLLLKGHGYVSEETFACNALIHARSLLAACTRADERERIADEERRLRMRVTLLLERRGTPLDVVARIVDGLHTRPTSDSTRAE